MSTTTSPPSTTPPPTTPPPTPPPTTPPPTTPPPTTPPPTTVPPTTTLTTPPPTSPPTTPPPPPPPPPDSPDPDVYDPPDNPRGTGLLFVYSKFKDATISLGYKDVYDNPIRTNLELSQSFDDIYYDVSLYTTGATTGNMAPYIVNENFATNQTNLDFLFTQQQNAQYFDPLAAQRYYKLLFKVYNQGLDSAALATIYHQPAIIDSVVVEDAFSTTGANGQPVISDTTGLCNFYIDFASGAGVRYVARSVDIYTGAASGTANSFAGFTFLKNIAFAQDASFQKVTLTAQDVPANQYIFYKFIPYDDFGEGFYTRDSVSGYISYDEGKLSYPVGIPPVLPTDSRTGLFFSGLNSPVSNQTGVDGAIIFQSDTGSNQDWYVVKSGQWKKLAIYEEITGYFARFTQPPVYSTGSGKIGDFSVSGKYLYTATGNNKWGRVLLSDWYGPLGAITWSGTGISGTGFISWLPVDQATGYIVYQSDFNITGTYVQIFSGTGLNYSDTVPSSDNYYYYNVAAFNDTYISSGTAAAVYVPA